MSEQNEREAYNEAAREDYEGREREEMDRPLFTQREVDADIAAAVRAERERIAGLLRERSQGFIFSGRTACQNLAEEISRGPSPTIPTVDIMPLFRKVFAAWQRDMRAGDGVAEEDVGIYEAARALVAPRTAEESSGVEDAPPRELIGCKPYATCSGSGTIDTGETRDLCPDCEGTGSIVVDASAKGEEPTR